MKVSTWSILVMAGFLPSLGSAAMPLSEVPQCGLTCALTVIANSECQSIANTGCVCSHMQVTRDVSTCVLSSCTIREALFVQRFSDVLCDKPRADNSFLGKIITPVLGGFSLLCFGMRVMARWQHGLRSSWRWDDWMIVPAVVAMIALVGICTVLAYSGLGIDIWWLDYQDITRILYYYFWAELLYIFIVSFTKISVLVFYLQIFPERLYRRTSTLLIALNVCYMLSLGLTTIFQCSPVEGAWLLWDGTFQGKCININTAAWAGAAISMALDAAMLVVPMPALWKLNMSLKKKLQVMFMFGLGIFVTVVSAVRLQYIAIFAKTSNPTQDFLPVGIWSIIEVCVGVICACLPAMRAVFAKAIPRVFGYTTHMNTQHSSRVKCYDSKNLFSKASAKRDSAGVATVASGDRNIRVKSEFIVRSRRWDEGSFVALDELHSSFDSDDNTMSNENNNHDSVETKCGKQDYPRPSEKPPLDADVEAAYGTQAEQTRDNGRGRHSSLPGRCSRSHKFPD